ncbi:MAG: substrate-binding domain-containing protein [Ramlibacter sp.]|uniref:substrate-binding domain-containing protein n=1 Tax=Ramlibacter sp. TaxID=1917967 RepID=UPI00262B4298|nr:substrate-binding domain-containing protein [Ramlibacter sp.]MDH4377055.1 substrate-binding domain-containing protein [Ramlibacter sp.]
MAAPLRGISSMATRQLLAELVAAWQADTGGQAAIESVGGVDAAKRVQAGEAFDLVFLASDAIAKLEAAGCIVPGSRVDLVLSGTSVAVPAGAPLPDISSEEAVRAAVLAAPSVSYSTGPSGVALAQMFERWGIAEQVKGKIVTPPPGTPVGSLVAQGQVALGFQQLSELIHVSGITIVGTLPQAIAIDTIFSGAVRQGSERASEAHALLAYMAAPHTAEAKRRQGMQPA